MLFLRQVEPNIRRYLPDFLFGDKMTDAVSVACNTEHESLRLAVADVANQFYVETATWGLTNWERALGIPTVVSDGAEKRRNKIYLKLQSHQVSTKKFMVELINRYTNDNSGFLVEHNNEYKFEVVVNANSVEDWHELFIAIKTYKPAHLMMYMAIQIFQQWEIKQRAECVQIVESHHNYYNIGSAQQVRWNAKKTWGKQFYWSGLYHDGLYRLRQAQRLECTQFVDSLHKVKPMQSVLAASVCDSRIAYTPKLFAMGIGVIDAYKQVEINNTVKATGAVNCRFDNASNPRKTNQYNKSFCWNGSHTWGGGGQRSGWVENLCTIITTKKGRKVGIERV